MLSRPLTFTLASCSKKIPFWRPPNRGQRFYSTPATPSLSSSRLVAFGTTGALACAAAYYLFRPDTPRGAPTSGSLPLAPSHFTPTTVISSIETSPTTRLLTLKLPPSAIPASPPGAIWSIYVKDSDIMVERPFTPLHGVAEDGTIQLWVKRYEGGEVGRWLHARQPGEVLDIRGPMETLRWPYPPGKQWDHVVLISGGTGFAPFFQLLHQSLLSSTGSTSIPPRFTVLHSSRNNSELPPPALLDPLRKLAEQYPDRLQLHLFVDEPDTASSRPTLGDLQPSVQRIDKKTVEHALGRVQPSWWASMIGNAKPDAPSSTLFMVCGPHPMINAIAGPYGRNFSQGEVGGVLGELGCTSDHVRKL